MNRYARNIGTLGKDGQKELNSKKVLVIGSGGLGGFVIEGLARMGIKEIGVCDLDVFDETNLNRQILSTEDVLGKSKVDIAKKRISIIDKEIKVNTYGDGFPCSDITNDIGNYDLVIDCLDNIETRIKLEDFCIENNIKLIHGAVGGYYGAVGVSSKDNRIISNYVTHAIENTETLDKIMGNPYSIVSLVSALQVHIAILVLLDREYLKEGVYYVDILNFCIDEI